MTVDIDKFILDQLSVWHEAAENYRALKNAEVRHFDCNGLTVAVQHNPARLFSSVAEPYEVADDSDTCFLCHRAPEQLSFSFDGRKDRRYDVLINLYPIFSNHLLICSKEHCAQSIWHRYVDMLDMAESFRDYVIFYNGPHSGASAPYHLHFQACPRGVFPLESEIDRLLGIISSVQTDGGVPNGSELCAVPGEIEGDIEYIASVQDAQLFHYKHFTRGVFALSARTSKSMAKLFYRLLDCSPCEEGEVEPRFNVVTWFSGGEYRSLVTCRAQHRPHNYSAAGDEHFTISPGCADMAGCIIAPEASDFARLDGAALAGILSEVSVSEETEKEIIWRLTRRQPMLEVGIMSAPEIVFEIISDGAGPQKVTYQEGKINYNGALYDELCFEAVTMSTLFAEPSFVLHDVVIGVNFHWERKVLQKFAGTLKFIVENNMITAVNVIGIEDYLLSVISSEMKSSATLEFLKAHAVISRSWVMAQLAHRRTGGSEIPFNADSTPSLVTWLDGARQNGDSAGDGEVPSHVEWFDHDDHKHFDVCADDHCQRYQGLTMAVGDTVRKAIDQTWGLVMMSEGELVDARFYKSCGGALEKFSTCWEDKDYPYLVGKLDSDCGDELPDLTVEENARRWIMEDGPEVQHAFCNTHDEAVLSQVLNDYDLETQDFYRWKTEYDIDYASELFARRSGVDFGTLTELIPLERGVSGRIKLLRVKGTKGSLDIGKELIIRKYFSESHLKSSAFVTEFRDGKLIFTGAGWGHGVGLCQIGAAVMAYKGYDSRQILEHYYPGHELVRINEK